MPHLGDCGNHLSGELRRLAWVGKDMDEAR